jgi:hypothetical protein
VSVTLLWEAFEGETLPGRVELRIFLIIYFITLPLQLISIGSLLTQGSTGLVAITALHAGTVAALFWSLLANALVATQVVEDGTISSLIVSSFVLVVRNVLMVVNGFSHSCSSSSFFSS